MEASCSSLQSSPSHGGRQDVELRGRQSGSLGFGERKVLNPHSLWPAPPCQPSGLLSKVKLGVTGFEPGALLCNELAVQAFACANGSAWATSTKPLKFLEIHFSSAKCSI